jgi:hypothetical protein
VFYYEQALHPDLAWRRLRPHTAFAEVADQVREMALTSQRRDIAPACPEVMEKAEIRVGKVLVLDRIIPYANFPHSLSQSA